jgi:hypothetical protein
MNTYICRYCRQPSDSSSPTCPLCGAPVDIRSSVSDSGWVEQPPIKDMARLQFGQSHVQIAGTTVPVAEFNLAQNDWIYFSHHVLLWTEPQTQLTNMPMRGAWNRKLAGLPLIMVEGRGPGHLALSDNHAGEVVAQPDPADPAERPALPRRVRPDVPAPGVPAEHGLRLLEQPMELPQHLAQALRSRPGRGTVHLRPARGHRDDHQPFLRDNPPLVTALLGLRHPGILRGR